MRSIVIFLCAIMLSLGLVTACDKLDNSDIFEIEEQLKELDVDIVLSVVKDYDTSAVMAHDYNFAMHFSVFPESQVKNLAALNNDAFKVNVEYFIGTKNNVVGESVITIVSAEENGDELVLIVDGSLLSSKFFDGEIGANSSLSIQFNDKEIKSDLFSLTTQCLSDAKATFMAAMNQKALFIGMTNSIFNNPYGGEQGGFNVSTVSDLLKMAVFAYGIPKIQEVWSASSATCQISGPSARTVTITSSAQNTMDSYYAEMHSGLKNPYVLMGAKGGGWSYGDHKSFSYIGVTKISGQIVVAVSATVNGDGLTGRIARMKGLIELFDIASAFIAGQGIDGMSVINVEKAIVAVISDSEEKGEQHMTNVIYSLNPDVPFNPASTSKVLAMITMTDVICNYEERHLILSSELLNDSSTYIAQSGDVESYNTSLYAMMLASNAANTLSLARVCGEKILESSF